MYNIKGSLYMKKFRYSDSQIMDALKRVDAGLGAPDVCR